MLPVKDNARRGRLALSFTYVMIGILILSIAGDVWQYQLIGNYDGSNYDMLILSDNVVRTITLIRIVVFITYIVLFIQWFRRAYFNLTQLAPHSVSYSDGWAAGSWFVPFLNLVRPYQIMKEIWDGYRDLSYERTPVNTHPALLGFWWTGYLLFHLLNNISFRMSTNGSDTIETYQQAIAISSIGDVFGIAGFLFLASIIKSIMRMEEAAIEIITTPSDSIFAINSVAAPEQ